MQELLWPDGLPGQAPADDVAAPTLTTYLPSGQANGGAVVVCPGGGYTVLADHEGEPIARWLNTLGLTSYVLHYRLGPHSRHPAMLQDAARAMRTIRARAVEEKIDPNRIGILGFSAGGHLASTVATHFDPGSPQAADPIERVSSRPDIAILIYPVITLQDPHGHAWSRTQLLGEEPGEDLIAHLSNHLQVSPQTPPTFLVHSADDAAVPCENSLLMAQALSQAHVPFELHLYQTGEHGFGLGGPDPILSTWPAHCAEWLRTRGFLSPSAP